MFASIAKFLRDENGNAVEYALVVALIGLALTGAFNAFSTQITTAFNRMGTTLSSSVPGK